MEHISFWLLQQERCIVDTNRKRVGGDAPHSRWRLPWWSGVVIFAAIGFVTILWERDAHTTFDSRVWKESYHQDKRLQSRRRMIRDLVARVLPGLSRNEIEQLLGPSPTPEEARLAGSPDLSSGTSEEVRQKRIAAGIAPEAGYFTDCLEYDWDLAYHFGRNPRPFLYQVLGIGEQDPETLLIRLGDNGRFESWYIVDFGQTPWEKIVGSPGNKAYRESR